MHRLTRHSDYYPTPLQYQYKYFHPLPVHPNTQGTDPPRTHACLGTSYHDPRCQEWTKIGISGTPLNTQVTAVRDHSLKKVLPWRASPVEDVKNDTSFYTGRGVKYKGDADIFGTPMLYKFPDLVTGSNVCASHANKTHLGIKFSPSEWSYNNQQLYAGAECVHNTMMMMSAEGKNRIDETSKDQVRCAADTSKDIDNRLHDIRKWLQKEKQELSANISQTHQLMELRERVEQLIKNLETPLQIAQENLYARESRPGVELVHDAVEDSLLNEVETIRQSENTYLDQIDKINAQLTKLRASRHDLELDIRNKDEAKQTDECVKQLCQLSMEVGHIYNTNGQLAKSSPVSWLQNTQALIQRSQDERNTSQVLMGEVNRIILCTTDKCANIWNQTNTCLSSRIRDIVLAREHIQHQYNKIKHDIEILNRRMNEVKKALEEKKPALKVAQTRAEKRTQRPGLELCHDKVAIALHREIHTLELAIEKLAIQLNDMETTMSQLMKTKSSLEKDLKLKDVALFVDREKCLNFRQTCPPSAFRDSSQYPSTKQPVCRSSTNNNHH